MKTRKRVTKLISQRELTPKATVNFGLNHTNCQRNRPCFYRRHLANPWRVSWSNTVRTTARAYRDYCAHYSSVRFARWIRRGGPMAGARQSAQSHSELPTRIRRVSLTARNQPSASCGMASIALASKHCVEDEKNHSAAEVWTPPAPDTRKPDVLEKITPRRRCTQTHHDDAMQHNPS
jgi:hypothetical protein